MNMEYPVVSVISINYNQSAVTCEMIESLLHCDYPFLDIIIVDNASPSDNPDIIKEKYPMVQLIKSSQNLGFAGGNNLGLKYAKADFIFYLNNDTIVPKGAIHPLVEKLLSDSSIALVSPKIQFHHTPGMVQYAGYTEINKFTIQNHNIGYKQMDTGQFKHSHVTNFAHGAAMMTRKDILDSVGKMTDVYFLYYEELDWGYRIREKGYQIWYVAESCILHKESISTGKNSPLKTYYINRNRLLFLRRNIHGLKGIIGICYQIGIAFPKNATLFLFKLEINNFKSICRAFGWHISHLFDKNIHQN